MKETHKAQLVSRVRGWYAVHARGPGASVEIVRRKSCSALRLFCFVGNEALSACETIAELWDGRLRGGGHWSG